MTTLSVLTGVDLPFEPSCGSIILCDDLYKRWPDMVSFIGLAPAKSSSWSALNVELLSWTLERDQGLEPNYVDALTAHTAQVLAAQRFELIHLHHLTFGMAQVYLRLKPTQPIISFCHGTDLLAASQDRRHLEVLRGVLSRSNACVFPTAAMYKLATTLTTMPLADKSKIIPWGIEDGWLERVVTARSSQLSPLHVLFAGRWSEDKGGELFLDALALSPKLRASCVVSLHERERVEMMLDARKLANRVNLIDYQPRHLLMASFAHYDALVIPSLNIEAFCLLAIEAMACGLPMIYAKTSGLIEVIGQAGVSFEPGSASALALALSRLDANPKLRAARAQAGLARAKQYSLSKMVTQVQELSRQVKEDHLIQGQIS